MGLVAFLKGLQHHSGQREETIREESEIALQRRSVYRRVELFSQPRQFCGLPITSKGFIISFSKPVTELFFKKRLIEGQLLLPFLSVPTAKYISLFFVLALLFEQGALCFFPIYHSLQINGYHYFSDTM